MTNSAVFFPCLGQQSASVLVAEEVNRSSRVLLRVIIDG